MEPRRLPKPIATGKPGSGVRNHYDKRPPFNWLAAFITVSFLSALFAVGVFQPLWLAYVIIGTTVCFSAAGGMLLIYEVVCWILESM